jgi:hypothetical protein
VQPAGCRLLFLPYRGLAFIAIPGVALLGDVRVEDGFVLVLVPAETLPERVLGPDDLTANLEPGRFHRVLELALLRGRVANVNRCTRPIRFECRLQECFEPSAAGMLSLLIVNFLSA